MGKKLKVTNEMIDPQLRTLGRLLRAFDPLSSEKKLRRLNKMTKRYFVGKKIKGMSCESIDILQRNQGSKLRICVMKPEQSQKNVPGVLWLHGGGYAIGAAEMAGLTIPAKLMQQSGCVIVSPDYRLSVESPYPAALEDAYAALVWMKEHASELGIDDTHLIVGGESAGGGLAAALCLYARDKKEVSISFQMPLYPMLDDRMETQSAVDNDAPVWHSKANRAAWKLYLGPLYETDKVPPYASPARATDYTELPPAVSFVGSIEPFRDETIAYFENLRNAGIPADLKIYDGCYHSFDILKPNSDASRAAISFVLDRYKYAIENYSAKQP